MAIPDISELPKSRKAAKACGSKYYFLEKPCKNGHISPRLTKGYDCTGCFSIRRARVSKDKRTEYERSRNERDPDRQKRMYRLNPERSMNRSRKWQVKNKKRINEYVMNRYNTDLTFKLKMQLRCRLRSALKKNLKSGSAVILLGCTVEELKKHISDKFKDGMTWENWGHNTWNIDHIRPLASFDLTDPAQLAAACHYTNLQPLSAHDNYSKSDKILP